MDAREANRRTLAVYEANVERYAAGLGAPQPVEVELFDRVARAAPGGSVLELGSGPGRGALELEARGLRVRRTDATGAFVERLRAQGHEADVLDALTDELGGPYDVLFAAAVLLHFDRDLLRTLLQRATRCAAWLACSVKDGDGEAWTDAKLGAPRWFVYWRELPLRDLLTATGWEVEWLTRHTGRYDDWLTLLARRA